MGALKDKLALLRRRVGAVIVEVGGHPIRVPPGVLDPVLFRSGEWLAIEVADRVAAMGDHPTLLDLGCGSGVVGVLAQAAGAQVTAVDLDPRACAAARANGIARVRQGDLFAPVQGERFDLIVFNPPYFPGHPQQHHLGRALFGGAGLEVVQRFAAEVDLSLEPAGGRAWVVWSDLAPPPEPHLGMGWERVTSAWRSGEELSLWERVAPPQRSP